MTAHVLAAAGGYRRGRLASALVLLAALAGCAPTSYLITPVSPKPELVEEVVIRESAWATKKIALLDIDGVLTNARSSSLLGAPGENPVSLFIEKLDRAAKDDNVRAVVLRINSPGGSVTASDIMYTELRSFRQRTGKPVIAAMLDIAASGGYYVACAADRIYASPTTVTGSIGVIMLAPEFSGTMSKIGARVNVIKSGDMKDAGSPFREMTEKDRAVFQGLIDKMYDRFLTVAATSRKSIPPERLRELADGRVYFGPEAKELGLVDEIGSLHDALAASKHAANLDQQSVKVVQYSRPYAYRANIYAYGDTPPAQVNLVNIGLPEWLTNPTPQFLYLWAPGW
jgi:protease-4